MIEKVLGKNGNSGPSCLGTAKLHRVGEESADQKASGDQEQGISGKLIESFLMCLVLLCLQNFRK